VKRSRHPCKRQPHAPTDPSQRNETGCHLGERWRWGVAGGTDPFVTNSIRPDQYGRPNTLALGDGAPRR
jgi:hypothetical protein